MSIETEWKLKMETLSSSQYLAIIFKMPRDRTASQNIAVTSHFYRACSLSLFCVKPTAVYTGTSKRQAETRGGGTDEKARRWTIKNSENTAEKWRYSLVVYGAREKKGKTLTRPSCSRVRTESQLHSVQAWTPKRKNCKKKEKRRKRTEP